MNKIAEKIMESSNNTSQEQEVIQYVIVLRDISVDRKLTRQQALQYYLQVMFASISHELRTPINIILNCLRCLGYTVTPE
jgi:signal transduction histidine kinase